MKSIKEKSMEICPALEGDLSSTYENLVKRNGFQLGANYVLDEIEKLTNNQNWCAFPKQSHKELKELIKQLKSNQ